MQASLLQFPCSSSCSHCCHDETVLTGMDSWSLRLIPIVMVVREDGQEPQAPLSFK